MATGFYFTSRSCGRAMLHFKPLLLLSAALLLGGCSSQVATSDIDQAEQLLQRTLVAWKDGGSIDELRTQDPPVYVAEDWWFGGRRLMNFAVDDNPEQRGTNVCFQVELHCSDDRGRAEKARVQYVVTTTPACTIARLE